MTQEAIDAVESRFEELKQSLTHEQLVDAEYLASVADGLEQSDPALAFRVMQRVRNLSPNDDVVKAKMDALKQKMKDLSPDNVGKSSEETITASNSVSKVSNSEHSRENAQPHTSVKETLSRFSKTPLFLFVGVPFLLFAFYQLIWATPRFESQTQLIVQQPNSGSSIDPSMALLAGLAGSSSNSDTELVRTYIHSNDMLQYLLTTMQVDQHYSDGSIDVFSRLASTASGEDLLAYYQDRVTIEIDDKSSVITVRAQGFEPEFTQALSQAIADRAEWYINTIGNDLATAQLEFVKQEHAVVEQKLEKAKVELLEFQRKYNLLNPEAEGMALQQITNQLDAQIAQKQTELKILLASMSESAPQVVQVKQEIAGLQSQLESERQRMTTVDNSGVSSDVSPNGVNEIVARYSEYKVNLELALQSYTASQISMEQSRIEAYRQLKYLVMVEAPILPEDAKYPQTTYNLLLFLVVNLMLFGIAKIIIATINELR